MLHACWCIKFFTFNRFIDRNSFLKKLLLASRSYFTLISQWKHYRVLLTSAGFFFSLRALFAGQNSMHGRYFKLQSSCECSLAVLERKPFKCAAGCVIEKHASVQTPFARVQHSSSYTFGFSLPYQGGLCSYLVGASYKHTHRKSQGWIALNYKEAFSSLRPGPCRICQTSRRSRPLKKALPLEAWARPLETSLNGI